MLGAIAAFEAVEKYKHRGQKVPCDGVTRVTRIWLCLVYLTEQGNY
jgi:hypothetical protein